MKYYTFSDLREDSPQKGVVITMLNEIGKDKKESKDMSVKYYDQNEGCFLFRFRDFEDVELKQVSEKDYDKLKNTQ